jgi:hypothetical protein
MAKHGIQRAMAAFAILALLAGLETAHADAVPPLFTISMGQQTLDISDDTVLANPDGSFTLVGQGQGGGTPGSPTWDLQWNVTIKEDPFIIGSVTITNLTSGLRTFRLGLSLPVSPAFSPSVFGGSISASLLDFIGNGAPLDGSASIKPSDDSGGSIYRGTIGGNTDANAVLRLMDFEVTCGPGGPGCGFTGSDSDGLPGPTLPGPGVASTIGTMIYFTLTPGDRVTFTTNFTVEPLAAVPLPAALPMLMLGLGAFAARRRLFPLRARQPAA